MKSKKRYFMAVAIAKKNNITFKEAYGQVMTFTRRKKNAYY